MSPKFGSWDGLTAFCWSGHTALSLLALVTSGVAFGLAISRISDKSYSQKVDDGDTNECKTIQLPDAFLLGKIASLLKLPERSPIQKDDDGHINDAISQLPDDLLCSILSRLRLIDAARTRILSRRWRNILAFRSTLTFDCLNMLRETGNHNCASPEKYYRFVNAVDQTLRLYSGRKITYAKISCCFAHKCASDFRRWMQALVSLGVEELNVRFRCSTLPEGRFNLLNIFPFPFHLLFKAVSLKHLRLFACGLQPSFGGQFKSLVTLNLVKVELNDGDIEGILSSCVNLQRLRMKECLLPLELCISGPCLRLKFLMIDSCFVVRVIDLKAVNLISFGCYAHHSIKYMFSCVPNLEEISILCNGSGTMPYMLGEVVKYCPDLKTILFQTESEKLPYLPAEAYMFRELTQLELLTAFHSCTDLLNFAPILGACPILKKFRLLVRSRMYVKQSGARWPVACHVHLKKVEFLGFCGLRNQIEFVSFLVRSTPALELLTIQPFYVRYIKENKYLKEGGTSMNKTRRKLIYDELVSKPCPASWMCSSDNSMWAEAIFC